SSRTARPSSSTSRCFWSSRINVGAGFALEGLPCPDRRTDGRRRRRPYNTRMFSKILIANRGEIALRIIRACREMGIQTVVVYSTADRDAAYLKQADQALCIGKPAPADSYLKVDRIIAAGALSDVEAIH